MPRTQATRPEPDTRARIVEAAFRVLAREGYDATSVKDIAAEAGVAPGLLHYYFASKEDLLVAVIERCCDWHLRLREEAGGLDAVGVARLGLARVKEALRREKDSYRLLFDMYGVGLHHTQIASVLRRALQSDRERIETLAEDVIGLTGSRPSSSLGALAGAIAGAVNGIVLQKLIDPRFDADAAIDALSEMAFALVGRAEKGRGP